VPREILDAYSDYRRRLLAAADSYRELDAEYFHLLDADSDPQPLPDGFDAAWTIRPSRPTGTIEDGDRIDLGERFLTVIHTPGHTPDCICLLDEREGILFGGDTINTGPIYAQFPDSDIDAFATSTRRLAELASDVRYVVVHHFGRILVEPSILPEIAEGFARVQDAAVELVSGRDCIDSPVLEARFDRFSVLLPDPMAPERTLTSDEKVFAEG
jgi:glyoxylase-like metal-dependent hydrolase (beta-lactamase superfamily II)